MLYAIDERDAYIESTPGAVGYCPGCDDQLIPHCGRIYINHWAHKGKTDCDPWAGNETPWHLEWKSLVVPEACDVPIGSHRADIVDNFGRVIQLQSSPLSADAILEREAFYGRHGGMVWLIDARSFRTRVNLRDRGEYFTFRWKHPRRSYCYANAPMFWDFGNGRLFEVRKIYKNVPCGGWGYLVTHEWFIDHHLSSTLRERPHV